MTVAAVDVPAEAAEFLFQVTQVADPADPGVGLHLVMVDDDGDLGQTAVDGRGEGLPELSLLQLTVSSENIDSRLFSVQSIGQRHPLGLRDAHAQRAAIGGDVRCPDVGMARQSVESAQLVQLLEWQAAQADQHRIEGRYVVPFRREVDVLLAQRL